MAQFRSGTLPLNIEVGRGQKLEDRRCPFCKVNVESEVHFLVECQKYCTYRDAMYKALEFDYILLGSDNSDKAVRLMRCYYKEVADFLLKAWRFRQSCLFT